MATIYMFASLEVSVFIIMCTTSTVARAIVEIETVEEALLSAFTIDKNVFSLLRIIVCI